MAKRKYFSRSPIRDLMREQGAEIVSKDALSEIITSIESFAVSLTKKAVSLTKHSKRKKVSLKDVELAATLMGGK